jgi:predicted nucleotidyltransferase
MKLTEGEKRDIKRQVVACLRNEPDVRKIVVFGSFLNSDNPADLDIAIFQDSNESYLPLALKYRRKTRPVSAKIPLDIIPIRPFPPQSDFLSEIEKGEVLHER